MTYKVERYYFAQAFEDALNEYTLQGWRLDSWKTDDEYITAVYYLEEIELA